MPKGKKWTKEEEDILVQAIKANPYNIKQACLKASKQLNRSHTACCIHWYNKLSVKNKTSVSFMTISPNSIYINRKNTTNTIVKPVKTTLWDKIKKFFKL